ncbi:hypothetical protein MIMGU_mgv1a019085mg, partial [Erythranthe guttata]
LSSSPSTRQNALVGFDELLIEVMDKLTRQQSNLCIIAIVGMGGIGKTTLPRNAYAKPLIMHQFDSRARVTVSQNYNVQEILLEILFCISKDESLESLSMRSEGELGERVHKTLCFYFLQNRHRHAKSSHRHHLNRLHHGCCHNPLPHESIGGTIEGRGAVDPQNK